MVPGFVDVHCHGGGGSSFATGDAGHAAAAIATHRAHGTTSLVASLVSDTSEQLESAVRALAPLVRDGELAGIHLEGPWLSADHCGAHDPARSAHRTPTRSPGSSTRVAVRCGW